MAAHLARGEGRRGTLPRSIFIHFARGEGLEGGRGDPPIGPHTPSISRRGRVAGGEGPPYLFIPPPVTASHRHTRTAPHVTAHYHKRHRLPPHLTSSQPSWLPSSGLSSHSYAPARAAADFSTSACSRRVGVRVDVQQDRRVVGAVVEAEHADHGEQCQEPRPPPRLLRSDRRRHSR